jgi:hypothetical protein
MPRGSKRTVRLGADAEPTRRHDQHHPPQMAAGTTAREQQPAAARVGGRGAEVGNAATAAPVAGEVAALAGVDRHGVLSRCGHAAKVRRPR